MVAFGDYSLKVIRFWSWYQIYLSGKRAHISTWCCPSCLRGGREEYRRSFKIGGYVFKPNDTSYINPHVITTALVHNFSSFIEAEVQKRTLDPFHDASYCAISPALENSHEGYLMAFLVHRCPHVVHKRGVLGSSNNLVFVQKYDKELRSQGYGYFLGFSYHRIDKFGGGPHDPRAFTINGTVYLLFRASVYANRAARLSKQKPILWDLTENLPKIAILRNNRLGARLQKLLRDKNWMPLVDNNQLYFVQSLDPVLVLSCTLDAVCTYIENVDSVNNTLNQSTHLMGGSQFQLWRYPYYIAAVQSRYSNNLGNDIYAAHLAIISLPHFRLVFFSEALQLNESLYKSTPSHHAFNSTWEIFFPVSLLLESQDSVLVGGHINYAISILVRVRGIQKIMEDIIKTDSAANPLALKPQPTVVQYFFQSSLAQNTTTKRSKK